MQTRPLSNQVLLACADQSARQRNMGIARNLAKALDNYLAKEGCLEDPFSKQILRNYQPCVSTPKTPEQHKECVNQKKLFISTLAQYFILQLRKNIPLTTMTLIVLCFGKRALERNASTFILWTWGRMLLKEQLLKPTHARKQCTLEPCWVC